jgi:hypothetical protein
MRLHAALPRSRSVAESPVDESRLVAAGGRFGPLMAASAVVLLVVLLVSAIAPSAAQAGGVLGTGIGPSIGPSVLPNVGGAISNGIVGLAVDAFKAIIKALFAPIAKFVTVDLIHWVVEVPNFAQGHYVPSHTVGGQVVPAHYANHVATLEQTVAAICGGVLGAVATFSVIRYWLAGFAGGGDSGFSALEGLVRTVAAALFTAIWPWLFGQAVDLTNELTGALLGSGATVNNAADLLAAGVGGSLVGGPVAVLGLFLMIATAVAGSLLFLGLLLMKVMISVSTILLFVGMPLAAVVWPIVPWVGRLAGRAFAVCLVVPVLWALCFATAAALFVDTLTFQTGSVANTLLSPLVTIVMLWLMLRLPVHLGRLAMLGGAALAGGGFVSRAVSYAAGSQLRDAARQHMPSWAGGRQETQQSQPESRTGTRLRHAATLAGAAATGGATAAGAAATSGASATGAAGGANAAGAANGTGAAGGAANGRAYKPPPTAHANAAGTLQNGLQTPSFAGREQDFANEKFEAQYRAKTSPVSAEQAGEALASLPEDTQRGVGQLVSEHGDGAREHLAYQAMGEWSPEEREALRTLAAATAGVRSQAVSATAGDSPSDVANGAAAASPGDTGDPGAAVGRGAGAPHEPWVRDDPALWPGGSFASDPSSQSGTPSGPAPAPPAASEPARGPARGAASASVPGAAPGQRSLPPAPARRSLPPPREPRGPSPDELFPNG